MAFSRDDNAKIRCNLNSYNNQLGYMLNVPGNGVHPDYFADKFAPNFCNLICGSTK